MKTQLIIESAAKKRMLEVARLAADLSYVPYSGRKVGAAILSRNGVVYSGAAIEDNSGNVNRCAESAALAQLIAAGGERPVALMLYAPKESKAPCSDCMRLLKEIGGDIPVYSLSDAFLNEKAASI
jgi:cytidine deaminase